ncbi:MAG: DNA polymerase Y family protein [Akkermansiaceae bacterium]
MNESIPLSALFIDFDAYFASVEQHFEPSLRGRPVGVVPVMAESSCCIAASYEAKRMGVKTGTRVSEAREICPGIVIVPARPELYVRTHHRAIEIVERCIHVEKVLSIDEMWAWLPYNWRREEKIAEVAGAIKREMLAEFSDALTCSIGVGPNRWLAKMASKMRKPDGYMVIREGDLPDVLYSEELSDIHGVGRSMKIRLHAAGVHTVKDLCGCTLQELHRIWGSVEGDRLYLQLRGHDVPDVVMEKRSIGHSHILPPVKRRPVEAEAVLHKLTQKAGVRLRSYGMLAEALVVDVRYLNGERWGREVRFDASSDGLFFAKVVSRLWRERSLLEQPVRQLGVTLCRLVERDNFTPSLFSPVNKNRDALNVAMDKLQLRFGKKAMHLGCDHAALDNGNMRIAFTHIPDLDTENY